MGIAGFQGLLPEMKPEHKSFLARSAALVFASVFVALVLGYPILVSAQKPNTSTVRQAVTSGSILKREHPFEPAEELVYVAEFSRALLKKVDVADFRFTASKQPALQKVSDSASHRSDEPNSYLLKFTGDVSSKGFFSKLFNLRFREQIESIVEPSSFTVTRTKRIDEQGKRARISETIYGDGKVHWTERDPNNPSRPQRSAEATFVGRVQDVLSAIYYLRTQALDVGKSFEVTVSDSGFVYQVPVQVIEKKRKKTVLGWVETLRVDPEVFGSDRLLSGDGQFSIWITNDSRRIPVSGRIKVKYGTFDITLRKVLQNPRSQSLASTTISGE